MKVVLTLMSSFYWMDIGICDQIFEVDVKAGHAKVTFFSFCLIVYSKPYPFCLFFYIALCPMFPCIQLFVCLAACRPRICSRNLCLHFQLFATFFVCCSQNAASLVLFRGELPACGQYK